MRERPLQFGAHGNLFGVLTEPDAAAARPGTPALLFANTGIHHHVGPNRIWVELARALAERGFRSLRFDMSGLGDSGTRPGQEGERERAVLDFRDAMEVVEKRRGASSFVLVGLCSGADAVRVTALAERRVAGVVFVDGYVWRTPQFWLRLPRRKLEPRRWRRRLRRWLPGGEGRRMGAEAEVYRRDLPTREGFRADLDHMLQRGICVLAIYSGGLSDYGYARQFEHMMEPLDLRGLVESEYYPETDHLFTAVAARAAFIDRICRWAESRYTAHDGARESG